MRLMKGYKFLLILLPALLVLHNTNAQALSVDSSAVKSKGNSLSMRNDTRVNLLQDSVDVKRERILIPKKAGLYSALIPGLGQIYNKQYFRAAAVYVAAGAAVYFFVDNTKNYRAYRKEFAGMSGSNPNFVRQFPQYNETQIAGQRDYYKRYLDLTGLLTGVGYALQVMEALSSAHLKGFDISNDISMRIRPVVVPQGGIGVGLVMNFK